MRRILQALIIAMAAFGLAAGSAVAQKAEPSKDAAKKSEAAAKDATTKAAAPAPAPAAAPKAELMDINSASEKDLATLKGVGEARAKAIVKHRPYKGKDELVQKKIIPQKVYDDIKELIIAKQEPKAEAKAEPKKEAAPAAPKKDEKKK